MIYFYKRLSYKTFILALIALSQTYLLVGCSSKGSKSPLFADDQILSINGQLLTEDGSAVANTKISLKNLRRFGFIDYTAVAVDNAINSFFAHTFLLFAWPFFPNYTLKEVDPADYYEKPNYFFDNVKTDSLGNFDFKIRAGNFLRDADGGINLTLVNQEVKSKILGKYVFVVKKAESELGILKLDTLGGVQITEDGDNITFSWTAPEETVVKYVVNFGTSTDKTLIWSNEVAVEETSLTLPKVIFRDKEFLVGVEAYFTFEEDRHVSSLSALKPHTVTSPLISIANGKLATSPNIFFKIDTLTNDAVGDNPFLGAFRTNEVVIDLETPVDVSKVVLHNLKLQSEGTVLVQYALNAEDQFTDIGEAEEKRFLIYDFAAPVNARYLKITFSSYLVDLQEISLF